MPGLWIPADIWPWEKRGPDFRTVAWNELIIDFDDDWPEVRRKSRVMRDFLRSEGIPHYIFVSGGRGVHISVFMDYQPYFLNWFDIRVSIAEWLQASTDVEFDMACVRGWADHTRGHLVRAEGGMRWHKVEGDGYAPAFKTLIRDIPEAKYVATSRGEVVIPLSPPELWPVPDELVRPVYRSKPEYPLTGRTGIPPCVERMVASLKEGGKLTHWGNLCVGTHLLHAGWEEEAVVNLYRGSSRFSEQTTRAQLHSLVGYHPPSHATIQSRGLCDCGF